MRAFMSLDGDTPVLQVFDLKLSLSDAEFRKLFLEITCIERLLESKSKASKLGIAAYKQALSTSEEHF